MRQSDQAASNAEAEIIHHFRSSERLAAETAVLDAAIRGIVIGGKKVTGKAIIIHLINELETTSDEQQLNVLRNALEIMVSRTTGNTTY